ncbi:Aste57867_22883 [Aphanomyces stellatus]|uniref:Aste57867_22883 protein n=1 Tax=Aphanomyces stellatus TaxID=120398 RepID=A0A485LL61_9STRA|nr:hypothetical protein As57867_022812 [Aphanomyces stellatus]VFT99533.1 Aste57867_22883 [Aphanomyces stellatus]
MAATRRTEEVTPMAELFEEKNYDAIKERLESGRVSDDDLKHTTGGHSILSLACIYGMDDIASLILERTNYACIADVSVFQFAMAHQSQFARAPVFFAVADNNHHLLRLLIAKLGKKIDWSYVDENGNHCLHIAVRDGNIDIIETLLHAGCPPNKTNSNGDTPLHIAAKTCNPAAVTLLTQAGADISRENEEGQTPLHVAVLQSDKVIVNALMMADADIDVKDKVVNFFTVSSNNTLRSYSQAGQYIIQAARSVEIKDMLDTERNFRVHYPVHCMVRNGDGNRLREWLREMTTKGPGVPHAWKGQYRQDNEWHDMDLKFKLLRDAVANTYVIVGDYEDRDGIFEVSGSWVQDRICVAKTYEDGYVAEYEGRVVGNEWRGVWKASGLTDAMRFTIPLHPCAGCGGVAVPNERDLCFNCNVQTYHKWTGTLTKGREVIDMTVRVVAERDEARKMYRLVGLGGKGDDTFTVNGTWMNDRIQWTQVQVGNGSAVEFVGHFNRVTDKWTGEWTTEGDEGDFEIQVPSFICSKCGKCPVANLNEKGFECRQDEPCNWKGQIRSKNVWRQSRLHVTVVRPTHATSKSYRLVGNGSDSNESFAVCGSWTDRRITLTKVYPTYSIEFDGEIDLATKEWTGRYRQKDVEDEFRFQIPMASCPLCASDVPNINELCLYCKITPPKRLQKATNTPQIWRGLRRSKFSWRDSEFKVQVVKDSATRAYHLAGEDKDSKGFFGLRGVWKERVIRMTWIYAAVNVELEGKIERGEWSGSALANGKKYQFRYNVPTWPCSLCGKFVPTENDLCFNCDGSTPETPQQLEFVLDEKTTKFIRKLIQVRENIAATINTKDQDGRSVTMHAAKLGHLSSLLQLIPFCNQHDLASVDNNGHTALEYALTNKLVCVANREGRSNDDFVACIDILSRRGAMIVKPSLIPDRFEENKKCSGDCQRMATQEKGPAVLAKEKKWLELRMLLKRTLPDEIINQQDKDTDATALHVVCAEGKADLLILLLQQPHIKLDIFNNKTWKYPLYEAAKNDRIECVNLLLQAGAAPNLLEAYEDEEYQLTLLDDTLQTKQLILDKIRLSENADLAQYFTANVSSEKYAAELHAAFQTPLHAAIMLDQKREVLETLLLQDITLDVDAKDKNGNSPLMLASRHENSRSLENIQFLLERGAEIDAVNKKHETALVIACNAGCVGIVKLLLEKYADIDVVDENGVPWFGGGDESTKINKNMVNGQGTILNLLVSEAQDRANSLAYRDKLSKRLLTMDVHEVLETDIFKKAINCNPHVAQTFLHECVDINRQDIHFSKLDIVYGKSASSSVLNYILHSGLSDPEMIFEVKQKCLEHIVMRRVLQIKWELFGQRKYIEQLLMNILLLVTVTISSIVFDEKFTIRSIPLILGVTSVVFTIVSIVLLQGLRPKLLWRLARYLHDGGIQEEPFIQIPSLPEKKRIVKVRLIQFTILVTAVVVFGVLIVMAAFKLEQYFTFMNNIVLWFTSAFFVATEVQEARAGVAKYFSSATNRAQMSMYLLIFFIFVPMKLQIFEIPEAIQIGIGGCITITLWILSVQFLEVIPSASYLLPMMSNLFNDVRNFFIFFAVFQLGLTITFYQLFWKKEGRDPAFSSFSQSFITTYFVTFGQLPLDSLDSFNEDGDYNDFLSSCAVLVMMFQAAVVVIVLLNVLLAMMNKTVDGGFERAKTEALASYAQCIYRLEESMNINEGETKKLIYFVVPNDSTAGRLNPIFEERILKSDVILSDDQEVSIEEYLETKRAWSSLLDILKGAAIQHLDALTEGLKHVQHFTTLDVGRAFSKEIQLINTTRKQVKKFIQKALRHRGQDPSTALSNLQTVLNREFTKLETNIRRTWKPSKPDELHSNCVILYQLSFHCNLEDQLEPLFKNIRAWFDQEIENADADSIQDPKLKMLLKRFERPAALQIQNDNEISGEGVSKLMVHVESVLSQNSKMNEQNEILSEQNKKLVSQVEEMAQKIDMLMQHLMQSH